MAKRRALRDMMHGGQADGLRIGEVATATGLTVRTLHHDKEVGLVTPTGRITAGHRLYGPEALERLYRVSLLRSLGLSLSQVRESLDGGSSQLQPGVPRIDSASRLISVSRAMDRAFAERAALEGWNPRVA